MLKPGDLLGERFEIVARLGGGGMGTLWRARHVQLGMDVALKVVAARHPSENELKRFKREAQSAARLKSPNLVQIIDFGEFKGQPYLAMELLHGEDLSARLAREGTLPFDAVEHIIAGIAAAVQVAHEAGIVHRDLKPANVFLERTGEREVVKVLDFGVAKDLNAPVEPGSTTANGVVGSPAYMSPEQVWNQPVSPRADVWAMGVIALELLTGKNHFADATLAKTFERILRDPLPVPSALCPELSPALDAFFARALARSAKERIGSALDFSTELAAALSGSVAPPRAAVAVPKQPLTPTPSRAAVTVQARPAERQARVWSGLIGVALALLVVGVLAFLAQRASSPPTSTPAESVLKKPSSLATAMSAALPTKSPDEPRLGGISATPERVGPAVASATARSDRKPEAPSRSASERRSAASAPPVVPPARSSVDPNFGIPLDR
jgi:serine/threonine-protein kinase